MPPKEGLDPDLEEICSARPELSELALKAHELEDQPGTPLEDPEAIRKLLGLWPTPTRG